MSGLLHHGRPHLTCQIHQWSWRQVQLLHYLSATTLVLEPCAQLPAVTRTASSALTRTVVADNPQHHDLPRSLSRSQRPARPGPVQPRDSHGHAPLSTESHSMLGTMLQRRVNSGTQQIFPKRSTVRSMRPRSRAGMSELRKARLPGLSIFSTRSAPRLTSRRRIVQTGQQTHGSLLERVNVLSASSVRWRPSQPMWIEALKTPSRTATTCKEPSAPAFPLQSTCVVRAPPVVSVPGQRSMTSHPTSVRGAGLDLHVSGRERWSSTKERAKARGRWKWWRRSQSCPASDPAGPS